MGAVRILDSVTVPTSLTSLASSGQLNNDAVINGIKQYTRINLGNDDEIVIEGPSQIYVSGDVILGNGASMVIDANNDAGRGAHRHARLDMHLCGNR